MIAKITWRTKHLKSILSISIFIGFMGSQVFAIEPIKVITSFSILSALAREIGGEKVEVHSLIGANKEPHEFNPKSSDIVKLSKAKIFFINGLGFEPWAERLIQSSQFKGKTVVASEGITPLKYVQKIDPHAWQDPRNLKIYSTNLTKALIEINPLDKNYYESRNNIFLNKMDQLYKNINDKLQNRKVKILVNHGAFNYFAQAFHIEFIPLFDLGFSQEPSAQRIASLINELNSKDIHYYAIEKGSSPQSVKQIATAAKLIFIGSLYADTLENDEANISSLFENNLEVLLKTSP